MPSFVPMAALCLVAFVPSVCYAATEGAATPLTLNAEVAAIAPTGTELFSTSALPDAPSMLATTMSAQPAGAPPKVMRSSMKPFSAVAIALKLGVGGIGFDIATPIGGKFNLRAGGLFFGDSPSITTDGLTINGTLDFKTVDGHIDWMPWAYSRHAAANSFHISPGMTFYNGNHLNASVVVPAGQTFSLNDVDYTSGQTGTGANPITGTFDLKFGNKVAPSLTVGWGNMIPRAAGSHWSVPFEIGFEYISSPTVALTLSGTACNPGQVPACQSIGTDPTAQANVAAEQQKIQSDVNALQVYPILSIGVGYKFGH